MKAIDRVRRSLLAALGVGAGATTLAAAAQGQNVSFSGKRLELEYDVAVLGHTSYDNEAAAANRHPDYAKRVPERFMEGFMKSDLRGGMQYHEGLIYPGGTISAPKGRREVVWRFERPPIGTFFDRGWVVINNKSEPPFVPRPEPHLLSHTDYYLGGVVVAGNLTPPDMIATVGLQHDDHDKAVFLRAVVGGTGRFATARGQMRQSSLGYNTSQLRGSFLPDGLTVPSPNFRIRFELYT